MEPDVIRMYSSSPPPLEDGEEEDDFGDFGGFSGVPNSVSFTEFDTPTSFNQVQALNATSPPELLNNGRMVGLPSLSGNVGASIPQEGELSKANGVLPGGCHTSSPSERTVGEAKKALSCLPDVPRSGHTEGQLPVDCNGEGSEVLTNGFAICEDQGSPPLQNCVHSCRKGASTADTDTALPGSQEDEFADFAAFSDADTHLGQTEHMTEDLHIPEGGSSPPPQVSCQLHCNIEQGIQSEANNGEADRIGLDEAGSGSISFSTELTEELSDWHQGSYSDSDSKQPTFVYIEAVCTATEALALNGFDCDSSDEMAGSSESDPSREKMSTDEEGSQSQGKASGNGTETETETETSFGRPLSTDALEEYGDVSTTGSVPSPPLQEDMATPADHSQLPEDDEDFGDFDSGGCFGAQGFADFDQLDVQPNPSRAGTFTPGLEPKGGPRQDDGDAEEGDDDGDADDDDGDDFGDFNTPRFQQAGTEGEDNYNSNDDEDRGQVAGFTTSNSFGNFNSVAVGVEPGADAGWSAFSEEPLPAEGDSWAAFSKKEASACPSGPEEWHEATPEAVPSASSDQSGRTDNRSVVLSSRLERLFQHSFPENPVPELGEEVLPLKSLLEPTGEEKGSLRGPEDGQRRSPLNGALRADVWRQLQDIHEAFGLRHQWGGSHSNKTLLCSLGIDTRNILFTGQKKQPIIVPMYAASLGMLEPTKEPVKPVSAAEMIASIAQAPPVGPEKSPCPPDTAQQEALPPVQFDWSSSGLTNPLDGVDPELYELTTAKLDSAGSGSRVVDAFARLMSTMEKTSTSARKPKKEENLSQEAAKVIASLPDLSFMQAKVLMFPATLTPLGCSGATSD